VWSKELGAQITGAQWSPDGHLLIMPTASGEINLYDSSGAFMVYLSVFNPADGLDAMGDDWG
jgi:hypothetical protein